MYQSNLAGQKTSWVTLINIAPCVVGHGLRVWPSRARDEAKGCVRRADIREKPPRVKRESQNDEDEDENDGAGDHGYDPTVIQESQIKWLEDAVALGRDQESKR